jgi:transcriptional regulator with XRE-family HTH domain
MKLDDKIFFLREIIVTNLNSIADEAGSKRKISEIMGISEQQFQRYTNQRGDIKLVLALKICNILGLNILWLATGRGEKFKSNEFNTNKSMRNTPASEGSIIDGVSVRIVGYISKIGGISKASIKTGISKSQLDRYSKNDMDIKVTSLIIIADAANLSFRWLATGKGNMNISRPATFSSEGVKVIPEYPKRMTATEVKDWLNDATQVWEKAVEATDIHLPAMLEENLRGLVFNGHLNIMELVKLMTTINSTMNSKE